MAIFMWGRHWFACQGGEIDVFGRRTAYKGMLDDLRIYDRVLTENEINALFLAQ